FDDGIRFWVYAHRTAVLTLFAKVVSFLADPIRTIIICAILVLVPITRSKFGIPAAAGALSVTILNKLIKNTVCRERPDEMYRLITEHGYSFASGHSITSMFMYGTLIYLLCKYMENKKAKNVLVTLCAIMLVTVGMSRVYLGVHYPTDVLAGWGLGVVAICVTIIILETIEKRGKINGSN
ncbi:MAG: phosphatase PAP2 family protein, partial [Eubacterium sp.]|nr:phosphatase PAP2 family protein [Candidatus Colimonas fimequi]